MARRGPFFSDTCAEPCGSALLVRPAAKHVEGHSALMPANLTTLPHFSVSSATNFLNSAVVIDIGSTPNSASRVFNLGSVTPALISLLSFSIISAGVLRGAPTPYQLLASKPGTKSPTVGMSGSAFERV